MSALEVRFFDGRSSQPRAARLQVRGDALWVAPLAGADFAPFEVPLAQVHWPERTRHGGRIARLPLGASVQALDVAAWDAWAGQSIRREGWVVRAQQSWRGVGLALLLLVGVGAAMYQWGLPWAARAVTALVPPSVDALVGGQALASLDATLLRPSELPPAEQERLRGEFARMVRAGGPADAPPWQLEFRRARDEGGGRGLGPNALALPGGTIVLTDELVRLVPGDDDAVLGVLGHEYGHVLGRHAMRQLVQASALGFATSVAFGDYGSLITAAPVLLASLGYSRDLEREADAESLRLMRAAGIPPVAMVRFFEAVQGWRAARDPRPDAPARPDDAVGIAFSSHPATAERIAFFGDPPGR